MFSNCQPLSKPRPSTPLLIVACVLGLWGGLGSSRAAETPNPPKLDADAYWKAHIEPLLNEHCAECHSPLRSKGGLDLSSLQSILRGGERGSAMLPGRPEESNLYKFLLTDADPHMPPGKRRRLTQEETDLVKAWIQRIPVASTNNSPVPSAPVATAAPSRAPLGWTPPATLEPSAAVDRFLELSWKRDGFHPAKPATDEALLRRLYLDLIGRIPTEDELAAALKTRGSKRRADWIQALLLHPDHPRHLREVFDVVLMTRGKADAEGMRERNQWFAFLEDAFRRNRPWNEVVSDLILARPESGKPGAQWFLYERRDNPQAMAEAIAPVVYGVQIKCAQCHDHMVAREIKQAHYWGTAAAFMRSKNVDTAAGPRVAESAIGGFVSFANLRKESQPALLTFFNGRRVDEPRPKDGEKEVDRPELYRVAPPGDKSKPAEAALPKFSRRQAFAEAVTQDNPLLARAMVNRVWAMLFGRGIVHPVELMDSKHPPSHPELLDWLAADFAAHGHDVRRLIGILCNTRAYQLGSIATTPASRKAAGNPAGRAGSGPAPLPEIDSFSRFNPKPLSAEQLFRSLLVATGRKPDAGGKIGAHTEADLRRAFAAQFPDLFPAEYQASLQQAMFLSNSGLVDAILRPVDGSLAASLVRMPAPESRVREAYRTVFQRAPDREELKACLAYLADRPAAEGTQQLLWALVTSSEFQLNH